MLKRNLKTDKKLNNSQKKGIKKNVSLNFVWRRNLRALIDIRVSIKTTSNILIYN